MFDTWREAEERVEATRPVERGELTTADAAVLVSPTARRPTTARQLGFTNPSELRRAIVLLTVLGPCKANER